MSPHPQPLVHRYVPVCTPLYDVELERSKLAWEKERFAAEHAFREAQERRIADEKAAEQAFRETKERRIAEEKAIESERFAIEQDRLARDRALREEEIRLRSRELARRVEESERPAVRVKLFGDAMRNSAIRMGNDPLDLIPFLRLSNYYFEVWKFRLT